MHPIFFLMTDPAAGAADSQAEGEGNASAQSILKLLHDNHFLTPLVISFFYRYQERTLLKDNKELREKVLQPSTHWYQ
jgi:hypothetical protein